MSELADWLRGLYDRGANPALVLRDDLKRVIDRIEELERDIAYQAETIKMCLNENTRFETRIEELERALRQIARPGDFTLPAEIARAVLEKKS